jgi:hypothetical protein
VAPARCGAAGQPAQAKAWQADAWKIPGSAQQIFNSLIYRICTEQAECDPSINYMIYITLRPHRLAHPSQRPILEVGRL